MSWYLVCETCGGSGVVPEQHDYATEYLGCPDCRAMGRIEITPIAYCETHHQRLDTCGTAKRCVPSKQASHFVFAEGVWDG